MAKKPTISTISSGYYSRQALNNNFEDLRDAFDNTLSLDGSTPNAMQADLDLNNNDILNAQEISANGLRIDGVLIGSSDIAAAGANMYTDSYTGDGSTVAYTMSYQPFIKDNTQVYIDGVYQAKDGYTISGTTLTFSEAPPLNSDIEIVVARSLDTLSGDADIIQYNQGDSGAVDTTVGDKLREFVSVKDFGAVGDGVTDDTAALTNAIAAQVPLYFGDETYKITSPIAQTLTKDVLWKGRGATISYENPSHSEYALRLSDTTGVDIVINNLTIDGTKQANKILEVLNNTSNTTPTNFVANELRVENCKRLNTFSGGSAVYMRGAFEDITFNGGWVKDCELPTGQGTPGSVGIGGISVTFYSDTSYARRVTLNGTLIEKVYSSDLTYTSDQDGFKHFAPDVSGGTSGKVESDCVVMGGSRFVNCYGRSIKTQVRNTVVRDSHFQRTEGLTGGVGNPEVNAQSGSQAVSACTFSYSNSQIPGAAVSGSTTVGFSSSTAIRDCEVYLESGTDLDIFYQTFPSVVSADPFTNCVVQNCKIFGTVTKFVDFTTNSERNHLTVSDNWVDEIAVEATTSQRNLVYVRTSGASPQYAYVNARGNVYAGANTAYLGRDSVAGTQMDASWSAYDNFGFVNDWDAQVNDASDPLSNHAIAAKLTGEETSVLKGYFGMQTKFVANGATETFNFRANNTSLIILQGSGSSNDHAIFSVAGSTSSIATGSGVALGTTSNPGTGNFNVWRSGLGEISVENDSGSNRTVSVWVFAPN